MVIVESPAKARTIGKYLGAGFKVVASQGHVRDLPARSLGVQINQGFKPSYQVIPGRKKVIDVLRKEAEKADEIYLAADPDREGEAICFHLRELLDEKRTRAVFRVLFNEITKGAILEAFDHPLEIDSKKVDAQQARRILDRLVGYKVSPLLWKSIRSGLSAGRVQTVALRMIVEREREIQVFVPEEYWEFRAQLEGDAPPPFEAAAFRYNGRKFSVHNQETADRILGELKDARYVVDSVGRKERKRRPVPPFITSKLQQEAVRKLGFTVKKAMSVAQRLYEGVELGPEGSVGLITYMRTDSTRVSESALQEVRELIARDYGELYLPGKPIQYQTKQGAQDAHEAIRPTSMSRPPGEIKGFLDRDELKLYTLIWNRFVASQMNPALYDQTEIVVKAGPVDFKAVGSIQRFDGFLRVYRADEGEGVSNQEAGEGTALPEIAAGQELRLLDLARDRKFTQPPPRFNEASLVKALEEKGIGRPSTYQQILANIQNRDYVHREEGRFLPTPLGMAVNDLLISNFSDLFGYDFTAKLEKGLDQIEEGKAAWVETLKEFYESFRTQLKAAEESVGRVRVEVTTDEKCPECGKPMVMRRSPYGPFLGCSGYPDCKGRVALVKSDGKLVPRTEVPAGLDCPKCGSPLVRKRGRFGEFVGCSNRECRYIHRETTGVSCPECGKGELEEKRTKRRRVFYGCNRYPECKFLIWQKPIPVPCPLCGHGYLVEKTTKREGTVRSCPTAGCGHREVVVEGAEVRAERAVV